MIRRCRDGSRPARCTRVSRARESARLRRDSSRHRSESSRTLRPHHVMGTATVLEVCRRYGIKRIVYISSAEVYGRPRTPRVAEDAALRPLSPYAAAKAGAEKLVEAFSSAFGLEGVILRPFAIYGPGLSSRSMIGTVIRQTRRGHSAVLRDLRPVRDFCHVTDVADAIVRACTAPLPRLTILNVGSGRGTSVAQVARRDRATATARILLRVRSAPPERARDAIDRLVADPAGPASCSDGVRARLSARTSGDDSLDGRAVSTRFFVTGPRGSSVATSRRTSSRAGPTPRCSESADRPSSVTRSHIRSAGRARDCRRLCPPSSSSRRPTPRTTTRRSISTLASR